MKEREPSLPGEPDRFEHLVSRLVTDPEAETEVIELGGGIALLRSGGGGGRLLLALRYRPGEEDALRRALRGLIRRHGSLDLLLVGGPRSAFAVLANSSPRP